MATAGLAVWLAGAIFFLVVLGVFEPRGFAKSPVRESSLSLPVVGVIIVLYLMVQAVCAVGAVGLGYLTWADLKGEPAATAAPETAPATTASAPATTAPATEVLPSAPGDTAQQAADREMEKVVVMNVLSSICAVVTIGLILLGVPWLFKGRYRGLGLTLWQMPGGAARGVGAFFINEPVWLVFALVWENLYRLWVGHDITHHQTIQALEQHPQMIQQVILVVVAVVVAPVSEELFFRGIVQTTLVQYGFGLFVPQLMPRDRLRLAYRPSALHRWGAIAGAAVFFAFLHQPDQRPLIFALALALGYVYERTGNLWASITLHMLFNLTNISSVLAG